MTSKLIQNKPRKGLDNTLIACYNSIVIRRESLIKVTWKRYRNDTEPKEKFFDRYLDAKVFFMFLQTAKWATCPTLTDIGYDHAHHSFSR